LLFRTAIPLFCNKRKSSVFFRTNRPSVTKRFHSPACFAAKALATLTAAAAATPQMPFLTRYLHSQGFAAAESRDYTALTFALRERDLPAVEGTDVRAPVVFTVTPYSSTGVGGRPLAATAD